MNEIVNILMERDGISECEAIDLINETKATIYDIMEEGNIFEVEDIIMDRLGLEPDYLLNLLDY